MCVENSNFLLKAALAWQELFSFNQFRCSFYTQLKADYIISNNDDYVFVVKENGSEFECRCCSAFKIAQRNYTNNQKKLKIVSK